MRDQLGWRGFSDRLAQEATQFANFVPQMPRLLHRVLAHEAENPLARVVADLVVAQRRTRRTLTTGFAVVGTLLVALLCLATIVLVHGRWPWWTRCSARCAAAVDSRAATCCGRS